MQQRASVWFVFTVVLIDMIGFGLVMPVLPGLIMELGRMSIDRAAIWAGWLAAGYAAMQFVCAPVIGNLSDRFGRRPVLLACLFAYGCDYLLQGFAPSLAWLLCRTTKAQMPRCLTCWPQNCHPACGPMPGWPPPPRPPACAWSVSTPISRAFSCPAGHNCTHKRDHRLSGSTSMAQRTSPLPAGPWRTASSRGGA